jgi:hypothetical protein
MFSFGPVLATLFLVPLAGSNLACSQKPTPGDTTFNEAKKGFEKELSPAQRKAAIKQMQTETTSKP